MSRRIDKFEAETPLLFQKFWEKKNKKLQEQKHPVGSERLFRKRMGTGNNESRIQTEKHSGILLPNQLEAVQKSSFFI